MVRVANFLAWDSFGEQHVSVVVVCSVLAVLGIGVFVWGTTRAQKAIAANVTPKRNLLWGHLGLAAPFVLALAASAYEYAKISNLRADLPKGRDSGASEGSGSKSGSSGGADGARFTKERVEAVAKKRGLKAERPNNGEFASTPLYSVSLDGGGGSAYVTLMDLRTPGQADGADTCGASGSHAVCVRIKGPGGMAEAEMLKAALLAQLTPSTAAVGNVLRGKGYKVDKPSMTDSDYVFGSRTYLAFADKGGNRATAWVNDFSPLASGKSPGAARAAGGQVVLVSTQFTPTVDAKGILADIVK